MTYKRLGDVLLEAEVITDDQLKGALEGQKQSKRRLGEELIETGVISEQQLIGALTRQLGIEFIDLINTTIDSEMTKFVSKTLASTYLMVPVRTQGDELYLAMADPLNFVATEEARNASHRRIIPMIATRSAINHTIARLYDIDQAKRAISEMQKQSVFETDYTPLATGSQSDESTLSAPTIRLVDSLIERGVADRASDIHLEPQEYVMRVRLRVDGILHEALTIPKELQSSVVSRIKIMCGMDVTERRIPQDGRTVVRIQGAEVDLRASTLRTVYGEKVVLRLLRRDEQVTTPESLGFSGHNLDNYYKMLLNKQGVILMVGPTGSGKSSTLFTMIHHLNSDNVNIVTLEDPVEYNVDGVNQVQVNEKAGITFARGLRSILRQDPDIVAVGEIRDAETAEIAMRAAITGHLVLSTVHTSDALSTIDRLHDVGIEPYLIATALKGVISQRLVRRICPQCRMSYTPSLEELEVLGLDPNSSVSFYRGKGCSECFQTGYRGRIAVAESLVITKEVSEAIHEGASKKTLESLARAEGFQTIKENCCELVLNGITTVDEAFRTIYSTD